MNELPHLEWCPIRLLARVYGFRRLYLPGYVNQYHGIKDILTFIRNALQHPFDEDNDFTIKQFKCLYIYENRVYHHRGCK